MLDERKKAREENEIVIYRNAVPPLGPKRDYDEWSFGLAVVNSDELTVRDFLLSLTLTGDAPLYTHGSTGDGEYEVKQVFDRELKWRLAEGVTKTTNTLMGSEYTPPESKLFPYDRVVCPWGEWLVHEWLVHLPVGSALKSNDVVIRWTIYLDDAPPSFGEIDLITCCPENLTGAAQ